MGREKDHQSETYDVLQPILIRAGVIGECSMHPGCTFIESESLAYAVATNAMKDGRISMDREAMMKAVQQILAETPDSCSGCEG